MSPARARARVSFFPWALVAAPALACGAWACARSEAAPVDAGPADAGADATTAVPIRADAIHASTLAYRKKYCPLAATCDPVLFAQTYGTMDTCVANEDTGPEIVPAQSRGGFASLGALPWRGYGFGYGALLTPDALDACSNAIDPTDCDAYVRLYYEHIPPDACGALVYGTLPNDSACGAANQCDSGRCFGPSPPQYAPCGACTATARVGEPCFRDVLCAAGSTCRGASANAMTCVAFRDLGESCDANAPCHPHLLCGSGGTCVTPPANDACDPATGCADVPALRYCNPATKTCEPLPIAPSDGACGPAFQPTVLCPYGATCTLLHEAALDAGDDAAPSAVCRPFIEKGGACNPPDHPVDMACSAGFCFVNKCDTSGAARCTAPPVAP